MAATTTTGGGRRARRTLGILGGVLGLTATFVIAAAGGALLHLGLPASRRVVTSVVNDVLAPTFRGKITILGVNELGLGGLGGVGVRVDDPDGHTVIEARGVRARISLLDAARSAIAGSGDIIISVRELSVDSADVSLDADPSGELRIARAFESATPAAPPEPGARELSLTMPSVHIGHAWVHGQMQGAPPIDADIDAVSGAIAVVPAETTITVHHLRVDARAMPRGANPQGVVEAYLGFPAGDGAMSARAAFAGVVGAVPLSARGFVRGDIVNATIDVPRTAPEAIRALAPEAPIHEPFSVRAEVSGVLPDLNATASVGIGRGTVDVRGHAVLLDTIRAEASVEARDIDARAFSPGAPGSALGADVIAAALIRPDGSIRGDYVLDVLPGQLGDHAVPRAALRGEFTEATAEVAGTIFEPGARTDLSADLRVRPDSQTVEIAVDTRFPDLRRLTRVKSPAEGSGRASVRATLVLGAEPRVDARAEVDFAGLKVGDQRLSHGRLEARAEGALADPMLDATLRGEGLRAGDLSFSRVEVSARGRAATPVVHARLEGQEMSLEASAALELGAAVTLRSPRLAATRGAVTARVEADRVWIDGANIDVDGGSLHGLGEPAYASVRNRPGELTVRAKAADLDLSRLAYLARMERLLRGGHLAFDIDLALRRRGARGSVDASIREVSFGQVERAAARVEATFDERRVGAAVSLEIGKLGALNVDAMDVELGGGPLDAASWQRATGAARIRADLNLRHVMEVVPRQSLPFEEAAGRVTLDADIRRRAADRAPSVRVSARTERLMLAGVSMVEKSVGTTTVVRPPPWQITGIDAAIEASIDDDSGQANVVAELRDARGQLVSLGIESEIPYAAIYREPARAARMLEGAPLRARLSIPRRKIDEFPDLLGIRGVEGAIAIVADVKGTALAPTVDLAARAYGVRPSHSPLMRPADAEILASYDGARADVRAKVLSAQREVLSASSTIEAKLADVLEPPEGQDMPWAGSADVRFCDFPLNSISAFVGEPIEGTVSGYVTLDDLRRDARLDARLGLHGVELAGVKYPEGVIQVRGGGGGLEATARLGDRRGFAEATAKLGMKWGAEVVPALDESRPVELRLKADRFRAAALQPFLNATFSDLDGLITANTSVTLGPGAETQMKGMIAVEKGRFQLSQVGEQFRNARAKVTFGEKGVIRLDDVFAEGPTGSVTARAAARMNGLAFVGANGWVKIPEGDPLPIVIEGESMGEASGTFLLAARMSPDKKQVTLNIDVPTLRVKIPEQTSHTVQPLEPAEHIRIGVHLAPNKLALLPLGPPEEGEPARPGEATRYRIAVNLRDAEIRRADDVRVRLEGRPTITVGERTSISGQIRLNGGMLDIQGKQFEIEQGTVTFTNGDPANPEIVVTAGWTAPDGARVYADFIGPLRTGKVTLRSEPPLSQDEILALIVFGTVDGANAESPPGQKADTVTQAVGAGGGIATQGLNRAFDDLTGLDITARVDTSASGNPRPEIKVQIARDIAIQFAHVLGVPAPGSLPDKNIASLEWRFKSNWSLLTSFGDRGSALVDVLWQYRY